MAHGQCASPAARSLSLRLLSHDLEAFGAAVFGMSVVKPVSSLASGNRSSSGALAECLTS